MFGFSESDDNGWFKTYSTGRFVMLLWFLCNFFLMCIYCVDLRAKTILPEMEHEVNSISDIDFTTTKIVIPFGEHSLYSPWRKISLIVTTYRKYFPSHGTYKEKCIKTKSKQLLDLLNAQIKVLK